MWQLQQLASLQQSAQYADSPGCSTDDYDALRTAAARALSRILKDATIVLELNGPFSIDVPRLMDTIGTRDTLVMLTKRINLEGRPFSKPSRLQNLVFERAACPVCGKAET